MENLANDLTTQQDSHQTALSNMVNPHAVRIASEHNYAQCHQNRIATEHCYYKQQQKRCLPQWMWCSADKVVISHEVQKASPDGVFNYASAVLNDGLLLLELRDAIHEGDSP